MRSLLILLGSSLCFASGLRAEAPPPVDVSDPSPLVTLTRPEGGGMPVNRLLTGSQYTYFDTPIRERIRSESLLEDWRAMRLSIMRYPGGTWGDHYLWDNPRGGYFPEGIAAHGIITVDEFLENARAVGAEPVIQVNVNSKGGGTNNLNPSDPADHLAGARWAAAWVHDLNIVKKRGVKYWEVGNETWIWYRPDEYARVVVAYATAMREVDPSIKIIACGLSSDVGPFDAGWLDFSKTDRNWKPRKAVVNRAEEWTRTLLEIAGEHIDYVAPHPYLSADKSIDDSRGKYLDTLAKVHVAEGLRHQQEAVRAYRGKRPVRLGVSEWVTNFDYSVPGSRSWDKLLYFYSHGNGINAAHYFGRILEGADVTDFAIIHELSDIQTLYYWPKNKMVDGAPISHPVFLAMRLWGQNLGQRSLAVNMPEAPTMALGDTRKSALYTFASEDDAHVYFVAINLDPDNAHPLRLSPGSVPSSATGASARLMRLSASAGIVSQNFDTWDGGAPAQSALSTESVSPAADGAWELRLAPLDMIGLRIAKP